MRQLFLAGLAAMAATAAGAEDHPTRCCGIVSMTIHADGLLVGRYQRPEGRLFGQIDTDGVVRGFWVQRKGFKACATAYDGSRHWGRFEFQNVGSAQITGTWGDCEADPVMPWGFQNDPVLRHDEPLS